MARPTDPMRDHHKALEEQLHGFFNFIETLDKFGAEEKEKLKERLKRKLLKRQKLYHI